MKIKILKNSRLDLDYFLRPFSERLVELKTKIKGWIKLKMRHIKNKRQLN